jgi:hypothetical protein
MPSVLVWEKKWRNTCDERRYCAEMCRRISRAMAKTDLLKNPFQIGNPGNKKFFSRYGIQFPPSPSMIIIMPEIW